MIRPEMMFELTRLEQAMQKRYSDGFKNVAWDYLQGREANEMAFAVERIIETEKILPPLSVILANMPVSEKPQGDLNPAYWDRLKVAQEIAERIVGAPFDNFIRHCNGNKKLASLYFGKAYWNANGVNRYDESYDAMIGDLEAGREPSIVFSEKQRTSAEVLSGLKVFYAKNGFITNRWYWKRFWPEELKQAEAR